MDAAEITAAIEALVGARAEGATVCPSEVARALAGADGPWRALMPAVRNAAAAMASAGRLSVTRGGEEVDARAPGGPIRLGEAASVSARAVAAALGLALPLLAGAACQVQSLQLPVKMVGSRAVATVGINGTEVPLTVDSGAFFSMLTDATAAQLQLPVRDAHWLRVEGVTGRIETRITTVEKLELLKGEIPQVQFIVGGNEPGAGTMGLMGRNLLSLFDTEYDLGNGAIRFLVPGEGCAGANMAYWAGSTPVTEMELLSGSREKTPAIRARVKLNGAETVALLDTGAQTLVSARSARRAGITQEQMQAAGSVSGAGRGRAQAWTAPFATVELGGEVIRNNRLRVADVDLRDAGMLLGIDFFLSHRIYVSKSQSKMFVTYNGGTVFALNRGDTDAAPAPATGGAAAAAAAASAASADSTNSAASAARATEAADGAPTADELARRGAAWAARRDHARALADLDRAIGLEPASAAFRAQRGAVYAALRRPAEALQDFDKALELDPALADARFPRAVLRMDAKDPEGARADLDALDRSLASQAQMRLAMSRLYLALDRPRQALAQLDHWLPSHPNQVDRHRALNSRCWIRVTLGIELDKAEADCDDAVDGDSRDASSLDSRGWLNLRLGRLDRALADFDRSLELRPAGAWSLYGRGLAKARLGQAAPAEADLAAARRQRTDIDAEVAKAGLPVAPAATP